MTSPYIASGFGGDDGVYTAIPSGMQLGMKRLSKDGLTECTFVQAGAAVAANKMCKLNGANYVVIPTILVTDIGLGCNDRNGTTVPANSYFWLATKGYMSPLLAAGIAAESTVQPSVVSGQLAANGATDNNQTNIVSQAASGAGGATLCFLH